MKKGPEPEDMDLASQYHRCTSQVYASSYFPRTAKDWNSIPADPADSADIQVLIEDDTPEVEKHVLLLALGLDYT